MRLTDRPMMKAILKPQNHFSAAVKAEATRQLREWLQGWDLPASLGTKVAHDLIDEVIQARIKATPPGAPDVPFSDHDKIEQLVFEAQKLAGQMDERDELMPLIERLAEEE